MTIQSSLAWASFFIGLYSAVAPAAAQASASDAPFSGASELTRSALITAVLQRHPALEAARQRWRAAVAQRPQAVALADPTLSLSAAPAALASEWGFGQVVRLAQQLPWPGKRALRGARAEATAAARKADLGRVEHQLREQASLRFDDLYVAARALTINAAHQALVERQRAAAQARYSAGKGAQFEPLQADVIAATLRRDRWSLIAEKRMIEAQINGLLHRPPAAALPPPPASINPAKAPADTLADLVRRAKSDRPELHVAAARLRGARHGVALAARQDQPDFTIAGTYNAMWPQPVHQVMIGVSLNLPLRRDRRRGARAEAAARRDAAQAQLDAIADTVAVAVRRSLLKLEEAAGRAALYQDALLPAAKRQASALEAGYRSGRADFDALIEAARRSQRFELQYEQAVADTWRSHAALQRAIGGAL